MLRLDDRREERRTARIIEGLETEPGLVDGIPVPPLLLRVRVTGGIAEPGKRLATGTSDAELIRAMLDRNGSPLGGNGGPCWSHPCAHTGARACPPRWR